MRAPSRTLSTGSHSSPLRSVGAGRHPQLDSYPTAHEFLSRLARDQAGRRIEVRRAGELSLTAQGIKIGQEVYPLSMESLGDLARQADIPVPYFSKIGPQLRADNFNDQFPRQVPRDTKVDMILDHIGIVRLRTHSSLSLWQPRLIETMLDAGRSFLAPSEVQVVDYALDGALDLALISSTLISEPRPGDITHAGVHLSADKRDAIQIGPALFRQACSSGSMARGCAKGKHRIRRGAGPHADQTFLKTVASFTREAWSAWPVLAQGLSRLAGAPAWDAGKLVARLRDSPFAVSARAARRVHRQLEQEGDPAAPTLYDLYNAISHVGSHDETLSPKYRYRLRLGAGALARGGLGMCKECGRMVLTTANLT